MLAKWIYRALRWRLGLVHRDLGFNLSKVRFIRGSLYVIRRLKNCLAVITMLSSQINSNDKDLT